MGEVVFTDVPLLDVPSSQAMYVLLPMSSRETRPSTVTSIATAWWPHANLLNDRALGNAMSSCSLGTFEGYGGPYFLGSGQSPHTVSSSDVTSTASMRGVLWGVVRTYPAAVTTYDTHEKRLDALHVVFNHLHTLFAAGGSMPIASLAIPKYFGCERDPDTWPDWLAAFRQFAERSGITITIAAPMLECQNISVYAPFPERALTDDERKFTLAMQMLLNKPLATPPRSWFEQAAAAASTRHAQGPRGVKRTMDFDPTTFWAPSAADVTAMDADSGDERKTASGAEDEAATTTTTMCSRPRWTRKTWFKTHIADKFTHQKILEGRQLEQGTPEWLEFKEAELTTSSFGAVESLSDGDMTTHEHRKPKRLFSIERARHKALTKLVEDKVWGSTFTGNRFTQWGHDHEDDGNRAVEVILAHGLMDGVCPSDYLTVPTRKLAELRIQTETQAPAFTVTQVMDGRGTNIDTQHLVLAYSYDGLYTVTNSVTNAQEHVLVEIKCLQHQLTKPKAIHMSQMMGMMGGLRQPGMRDLGRNTGYDIRRCIYVLWRRDMVQFWSVPFDKPTYKRLLRRVLFVWHHILLPLYVLRDNGALQPRDIELIIPVECKELEDYAEQEHEEAVAVAVTKDERVVIPVVAWNKFNS